MKNPTSISYEDGTFSVDDLLTGTNRKKMPAPASWKRISFNLDQENNCDSLTRTKALEAMLNEICKCHFMTYEYYNYRTKSQLCVIRFENTDDALLFKLRDGMSKWTEYITK